MRNSANILKVEWWVGKIARCGYRKVGFQTSSSSSSSSTTTTLEHGFRFTLTCAMCKVENKVVSLLNQISLTIPRHRK